ncbi:hypothetical protein MRB53_023410 [Persea americana]|uniref:Uncharacterized protein n=1 Tax=Persea americana TaxID=3435 RepID=A0ACC2L9B4_PERAE|nr:hypothetical protein MRB53_023410 [Persea americana]
MTRTRIARKRAPKPVESGEGPSGDLGGVPSGRLEDVPEVGLTGEPEAGQTAARPKKRPTGDSSARDGHGGPAPTTSEQARGTTDIICPDARVGEGEGAASDSDDEEYTAPLDELLASDDSDDPMDDGGSEGEKGGDLWRVR